MKGLPMKRVASWMLVVFAGIAGAAGAASVSSCGADNAGVAILGVLNTQEDQCICKPPTNATEAKYRTEGILDLWIAQEFEFGNAYHACLGMENKTYSQEVSIDGGAEEGVIVNTKDVIFDAAEVELLPRSSSSFDPGQLDAKFRKYKVEIDTHSCPSRKRTGAESQPNCVALFDVIPASVARAIGEAGFVTSPDSDFVEAMVRFRLVGKGIGARGRGPDHSYSGYPFRHQ